MRIKNIIPENIETGNTSNRDGVKDKGRFVSEVLKVCRVPFRGREGNLRPIILLLGSSFLLSECSYSFDDTLGYLYTNYKFGWTEETLMDYTSVCTLLQVVGQFLLLPFLARVVRIHKMLIGCLVGLFRCVNYIILATVTRQYMMYVAAGINSMSGVTAIIVR